MVSLKLEGAIFGGRRDTDKMVFVEVLTDTGKGKMALRRDQAAAVLTQVPMLEKIDVEFECDMETWGGNMMLLPVRVIAVKSSKKAAASA